jgi:hypothetical protein
MLHFDIDWSGLLQIGDELGATEKQVKFALSRAMRRTEATLRRMSSKGLTQELQLRAATLLRKRLKSTKLKMAASDASMTLWYGLNDMPVSALKGRPSRTKDGATFRDKEFSGGFVGRSKIKNRQTIFKRKGEERLPVTEQLFPVKDKAEIFIEDRIFAELEGVFWQHFKRDIQARVKYRLGEA